MRSNFETFNYKKKRLKYKIAKIISRFFFHVKKTNMLRLYKYLVKELFFSVNYNSHNYDGRDVI